MLFSIIVIIRKIPRMQLGVFTCICYKGGDPFYSRKHILSHLHFFFFSKQDRTISCNGNFQNLLVVGSLVNKIKEGANLNNIMERKAR